MPADYVQWSTSGQVRAAYILGGDRAMPRIGLGFDHFASASFTEGGDTFARLDVNAEGRNGAR
ncbi:hypothetical protein [Amaricoccus solimangrovi]|uniref:Uncharacterized protein n=1 Tax=Amaricoccus solimangrovi TaxID=2589815 RepID=A0A501WK16_9RHOB|nr:hypothetical protein [Amaricoccus solimangrovi]TPE47497.1 hypothetical protein FJM51_19995 [Amaricoccus solimangrovi]